MGRDVIVKKVQPYPIPAQLDREGQVTPAEVLKLVLHGGILNLKGRVVKVGDIFQLTFEIPGSHRVVVSPIKVIKTYDRTGGANLTERLAEVHFLQLASEHKNAIHSFLVAIRQTG